MSLIAASVYRDSAFLGKDSGSDLVVLLVLIIDIHLLCIEDVFLCCREVSVTKE